jgi:hypothetical protein
MLKHLNTHGTSNTTDTNISLQYAQPCALTNYEYVPESGAVNAWFGLVMVAGHTCCKMSV